MRLIGWDVLETIRRRRSLGNLGAILLAVPSGCLAIVLLSVTDARWQEERLQRYLNETEARVKTVQLVLRYQIDQETGLRGYLLTQDRQFLAPYEQAKQQLPATLAHLRAQSPGHEAVLDAIQQKIQERLMVSEQLLALANQLDLRTQAPLFAGSQRGLSQADIDRLVRTLQQGRQKTDAIRQAVSDFEQQQYTLRQQQQAKLDQRKHVVDRIQIGGAILSVFTYVGAVYIFFLLDRAVFQRDQTIQQNTAITQALTDNLIDGVILLDHHGVVETLNPAAEKILGYPSSALQGRSLVHVLFPIVEPPPQPRINVSAWLDALLAMGVVQQMQAYHRDGSTIPIELSISRTASDPPQLIVLVRDISERLRLTQALHDKVQELDRVNQTLSSTNLLLKRKNQSLESFVQAAAHDLKTPLRGISSLAQWIESDLGNVLNPDMREHFKLLRQRVLRIYAITNGLLSYARIDTWMEQNQSVDVGIVLQELVAQLPIPAGFVVRIGEHMPVLQTSYLALRLVFEQLIRNSVKHHDQAQGLIEIEARPLAHAIEFIVRDDGPGIDPAYRESVLRMFQVLERNLDSSDNIGVGLALVHKIIQLVDGTLELRSVANGQRGLEVRFTWPQSQNSPPA